MKTHLLSVAAFVALSLASCGVKQQEKETTQPGAVAPANQSVATAVAAPPASASPNIVTDGPKTPYELLQGKWQHTVDSTNFLVFEKNHMKEIAAGQKTWTDEEFVLSDRCRNAADQARNVSPDKEKYISVTDSDLCWYIVAVDSASLELSYVGRGNTLSYRKVGLP